LASKIARNIDPTARSSSCAAEACAAAAMFATTVGKFCN
jgi:hypothetical protein